jgi:hypothetical protein
MLPAPTFNRPRRIAQQLTIRPLQRHRGFLHALIQFTPPEFEN